MAQIDISILQSSANPSMYPVYETKAGLPAHFMYCLQPATGYWLDLISLYFGLPRALSGLITGGFNDQRPKHQDRTDIFCLHKLYSLIYISVLITIQMMLATGYRSKTNGEQISSIGPTVQELRVFFVVFGRFCETGPKNTKKKP